MLFGHANLPVALVGASPLLLHLPLIFVFPLFYSRDQILVHFRNIAYLSIPMVLLMYMQTQVDSHHFLNVGPGGVGTSTFSGAMFRFRPPGTFSFPNGPSSFFPLAAACFLICLTTPVSKKTFLIFRNLPTLAVLLSLIVSVPISLSRALVSGYLQLVFGFLVSAYFTRKNLRLILFLLLCSLLVLLIALQIPDVTNLLDAFTVRWFSAARIEAGDTGNILTTTYATFQKRFLPAFILPLTSLFSYPIFGLGIGSSTNYGSLILSSSSDGFLAGELAWLASYNELGSILGTFLLFWRISITLLFIRISFRCISRGDTAPLTFLSVGWLFILNSPLYQTTNVGFIVLFGGMFLSLTPNLITNQRS